MTMKATVNTPFKLSKKEMTMGEYLEEVLQKYEDREDALLLKLVKEGEESKDISTDEFYKTIDKKIKQNHIK